MGTDLVVKDNILIGASYNLEVTEQRLILLSIVRARETGQGITSDSKLEIKASDYAHHFNVTKEAAYSALKNAVNNLFERKFSFKEMHEGTDKEIVVKSRWVSRIAYVDDLAVLQITFAPDVVPLITRLEKHFTSYQLKQVSQITSKYGIRLYELLIAWRAVGKTPILELDDFRYKLGLENGEYQKMVNFKSRVLEPAIQQINQFSDISVSYEQHKHGRSIVGFSFKFTDKPKKQESIKNDNRTMDMFCNLSDSQISMYSSILSKVHSVSDLAGNKDYQAFSIWISNILRDPKSVREETAKRIFIALRTETDFKDNKS